MCHLNVGRRHVFQVLTPYNAHRCIHDSFRGEPIGWAILPSKNVLRQVKCADLTSSVRQILVAPDSSSHDLENSVRPLALPVNFLIFDVRCFVCTEIGVNRNDWNNCVRGAAEHGTPLVTLVTVVAESSQCPRWDGSPTIQPKMVSRHVDQHGKNQLEVGSDLLTLLQGQMRVCGFFPL